MYGKVWDEITYPFSNFNWVTIGYLISATFPEHLYASNSCKFKHVRRGKYIWGYWTNFVGSVYPSFQIHNNTCHPFNVTFIFHRCHRSLAAVTSVKYDCEKIQGALQHQKYLERRNGQPGFSGLHPVLNLAAYTWRRFQYLIRCFSVKSCKIWKPPHLFYICQIVMELYKHFDPHTTKIKFKLQAMQL